MGDLKGLFNENCGMWQKRVGPKPRECEGPIPTYSEDFKKQVPDYRGEGDSGNNYDNANEHDRRGLRGLINNWRYATGRAAAS